MSNDTASTRNSSPYLIPAAIIIAGFLIAGGIYFSNIGSGSQTASIKQATSPPPSPDSFGNTGSAVASRVKPVTSQDHIRGNPDAPIKLIEFSDLECPFCKRVHPTFQQILSEYGDQVAWVYRHFPLDALHSKARKEAEATECAAELGGNDGFWNFIDRLFEVTPSNDRLELSQLPQIAQDVGLERTAFEQCLASGKYAQKVADHLADAVNSGGRGTPYTIIVTSKGDYFPVSGALPFSSFKQVIDQALESLR